MGRQGDFRVFQDAEDGYRGVLSLLSLLRTGLRFSLR